MGHSGGNFRGRLRRDQRLLRPRGAVQRDRGADHDRAGRGPWQPERRGNRPDHRPPAEGRYSFGGENARRADLDALDRAKEMERQGVAMETIFRETGWYTGADGKWRFEIDDSGMEYSRWGRPEPERPGGVCPLPGTGGKVHRRDHHPGGTDGAAPAARPGARPGPGGGTADAAAGRLPAP